MRRTYSSRQSSPLFVVAMLSMCLVAPSAFSKEESSAQPQAIVSTNRVDDAAPANVEVFVTEPVFKLETLLGTVPEQDSVPVMIP